MKNPFKARRAPSSMYTASIADEKSIPDKIEHAANRTKQAVVFAVAKTVLKFLYELVFGGKHFCCCIPTRFGVIVGSAIQFMLAGALAIMLWFEVGTEHDFTFSNFDRAMFSFLGVMQTLLFIAAILGFAGAIARKQLFVTIYCVFLYIHLLANVGLASWVTWKINHVTGVDIHVACEQGIKNPVGQEQCTKFLGDTGKVIVWIIWLIVLIEFYGVLIVTRYLRQLRREKRHGRGAWYATLKDFGAEDEAEKPRRRGHTRAGSKSLILLDNAKEKSLGGGTPPVSAVSSYTSPGSATVFPLTPSFPGAQFGLREKRYDEDEDYGKEHDLGGYSAATSTYGHGNKYDEEYETQTEGSGTLVDHWQRGVSRA